MALGYGSIGTTPILTQSEVGEISFKATSNKMNTGRFTLFTYIVEALGSIAAPEFASVIGLAGASARLGMDAYAGNAISPLMEIIDFGAPVLQGIGQFRKFGKLTTGLFEQTGAISKSIESEMAGFKAESLKFSKQGLFHEANQLDAVVDAGMKANNAFKSVVPKRTMWSNPVTNYKNQFNQIFTDKMDPIFKSVIRSGAKSAGVLEQQLGSMLESSVGQEVAQGTADRLTRELVAAGVRPSFIAEFEELIARGYKYSTLRSIMIAELRSSVGKEAALRIIRTLPEAAKNVKDEMLWAAKQERMASKSAFKGAINRFTESFRDYETGKVTKQSFVRGFGKSGFNDVLQGVQNIFDGNDMARWPVEQAYKAARKEIGKGFAKLAKYSKSIAKLDAMWEKTGGTLVQSDVILGYKMITKATIPGEGYNRIMISFYGDATKGKKPVYVMASDVQLAKLEIGGMRYYLKTWAVSRGGTRGNSYLEGRGFLKFLSGKAGGMYSMLPVQSIRNLESLVSNIVSSFRVTEKVVNPLTHRIERVTHIGWAGVGSKTYLNKIVGVNGKPGGLVRAIENRAGRLLGKAVVGGAFEAFGGGGFVGREAQRVASTLVTSFRADASTTRGMGIGERLEGAFTKAAMTSVQGAARRGSRAAGSSYGNVVSGRRVGAILQRPTSSLSGGDFRLSDVFKTKI